MLPVECFFTGPLVCQLIAEHDLFLHMHPKSHLHEYQIGELDCNLESGMFGFTGCSKTSLARAAAGASGMRLQILSGAQLFSMYVGEGEGILRTAFQRSRMTAPSILFIDEIDAIVGATFNPLSIIYAALLVPVKVRVAI